MRGRRVRSNVRRQVRAEVGKPDRGRDAKVALAFHRERQGGDARNEPVEMSTAVAASVSGRQEEEILAAIAVQLVVGPQVLEDPARNVDQNGVADHVAVSVVDRLEVIEVQHRDDAGTTAPDIFLLLAKRGQHTDAVRRAGKRVEIEQRSLQFFPQVRHFEVHALQRADETIVVAPLHRTATLKGSQQVRCTFVHALVLTSSRKPG